MRRLHLFEFGDQPWFPRVLRDAQTAYLSTAYRMLPGLIGRWAETLATALPSGERVEILDLCSGAGGPWPLLAQELEKRGYCVNVTLSDLRPNQQACGPHIAWHAAPLDVMAPPAGLGGVLTMFSAFHHFPPAVARAILTDAFARRRAICVFESGSGTAGGVVSMLGVPIAVLMLMPLARPFRWTHLLFTYLIPVLPLSILWDGVVSMLRIYSPEELRELTRELRAPDYAWKIGRLRVKGIAGGLPYLMGLPARLV